MQIDCDNICLLKDHMEPKFRRDRSSNCGGSQTSPSVGNQGRTARNPSKQFDETKVNSKAKTETVKAIHTVNDETFEQFSREVDLINTARDAWIDSITSGKPFDITKPCLACGEMGHTFQDCPILENLAFLWRHFINSQMNAVQNQKMLHEAVAKLANTHDCDGGSKLISLKVQRTCASQSNQGAFQFFQFINLNPNWQRQSHNDHWESEIKTHTLQTAKPRAIERCVS